MLDEFHCKNLFLPPLSLTSSLILIFLCHSVSLFIRLLCFSAYSHLDRFFPWTLFPNPRTASNFLSLPRTLSLLACLFSPLPVCFPIFQDTNTFDFIYIFSLLSKIYACCPTQEKKDLKGIIRVVVSLSLSPFFSGQAAQIIASLKNSVPENVVLQSRSRIGGTVLVIEAKP